VVPIAELPAVPDRSMRPPQPSAHEISFVLAVVLGLLALGLAWGESAMWGVVPCVALTIGLLLVPVTRWRGRDAGEELGDYVKATPFDGHAMQDGLARQAAVVTTSRNPIGCIGLFIGVLLPLLTVRWDHAGTVGAALAAIGGFVLAWIRRHRREAEASAGRGVPL
jgi:hypothetical protein